MFITSARVTVLRIPILLSILPPSPAVNAKVIIIPVYSRESLVAFSPHWADIALPKALVVCIVIKNDP